MATRLRGQHERDGADGAGDEQAERDEQRGADRAGERDGDTEAGAGHARHAHGLGGLLGGLEVVVGRLHLLDHRGGRSALVAAEAAEGHLDALDLLAGGDEPVGGAPQRVLIEQAQLADQEVGGGGQLRDGEHLQAVVERRRGWPRRRRPRR